jgi:hypothetical protein
LVESDVIDSAQKIKDEYSKLEKSSHQMRAELEARSEKIRNLEQQITLKVSEPLLQNSSSKIEEDQARGEKATAHWTMIEIKKLLVEAADTLQRLPIDEAYEHVRRETEVKWSEKVHKAITFCENVITKMQKCDDEGLECSTNFKIPDDSDAVGIESVILKLHERWRLKHHQLLESSSNLQNQRQICRELESRLSDAHEKLAEIESQRSSESPARLTAKQADNDALFRATAELAHTNVALQNELDDLQDKLVVEKTEEKPKVAKEAPESSTFVDASFKKIRQGAKTRSIISNKSKVSESTETTVILSSKPKASKVKELPTAQKDASWDWNEEVNDPTETAPTEKRGWDGKEPSPKESVKPPTIEIPQNAQTTSDDWNWNAEEKEKTPQIEITITSPSIDTPIEKDNDWGVWNNSAHAEPASEKPKRKSTKKAKESQPAPKIQEEVIPDSGWGDLPAVPVPSKKSSKPSSRQSTPLSSNVSPSQPPPDPSSNSDDWGWGCEKVADEKVSEWAWNEDERIVDELLTRPISQASSIASKTSKASTTKKSSSVSKPSAKITPSTKPKADDDWAWKDEEKVEENPLPKKKGIPSKAATPEPKSDDRGWNDVEVEEKQQKQKPLPKKKVPSKSKKSDDWEWNEEKQEEATDDWGW